METRAEFSQILQVFLSILFKHGQNFLFPLENNPWKNFPCLCGIISVPFIASVCRCHGWEPKFYCFHFCMSWRQLVKPKMSKKSIPIRGGSRNKPKIEVLDFRWNSRLPVVVCDIRDIDVLFVCLLIVARLPISFINKVLHALYICLLISTLIIVFGSFSFLR